MEKVCCFTGHRVLPIGERRETLQQSLKQEIAQAAEEGYTTFLAGGALGFDTMAAFAVEQMKGQYPQIRLVLVLPCKNQHHHWSNEQAAQYQQSLAFADEVIYLSTEYDPTCMHRRNDYLVNHSSRCIYFLEQQKGGTYSTVRKAMRAGLQLCGCRS